MLVKSRNTMKWILCVIICTISVLIQAAPSVDSYAGDMKNRNAIALECIDKVKIDKKIVLHAIANPMDLPTDAKYKEFLSCSYKKQGFQSDDGEILDSNVREFLTRFYNSSDLTVLDKCKNSTATDDGEIAYNYLKCVMPILYEIKSTDE